MNTEGGGKPIKRDVMRYAPPTGPTNLSDPNGPGLHGANSGNANRPVDKDTVKGSPGWLNTSVLKGGSQRG